MLMAAALLISTNAKAGDPIEVSNASQFLTAWETAGDVTITLTDDIELTKTLWLGTTNEDDAARKVVINLNGNELTLTQGFLLTHGTLEINGKNGEVHGNGGSKVIGNSCANELFFVTGARNPEKLSFTNLKIGEGVWVDYDTYKAAISVDRVNNSGRAYSSLEYAKCSPAKSQLSYNTNIYTKTGSAFGVNVEVAGKITATRYAVKTNGDLGWDGNANTKESTPFIHICSSAYAYVPAEAVGQEKKPLALYASGYARWKIEGTVEGNVGVAVKSGDVDIEGATISSNNNTTYTPANESNSGSKAEGCAVVISSEAAYTGEIEVSISEGATLTAGKGYALDESVATPSNGSKVDGITIDGGTFNAGTGSAGAITISETTTNEAISPSDPTVIVVTQAEVTGSVTIAGSSTSDPNPTHTLNDFTTTSAYFDPTKDSDPSNDSDPIVVVPLTVTPNAAGYTTYSAPIDLYLPASGLTAYVGAVSGEELELVPVNYIKKNEGVILAGTAGTNYTLTTNNVNSITPVATWPTSQLQPASAWASHGENIYVLVVDELWKYTGTEMKANKAYLDLGDTPGPKGAPKRITLKAEETQAVENVETTIESVKFMENGQIFIRRGENIYNVQGQIVK